MLFRKSPEQLIEEAEQALAEREFEKARRIAAQLLRMQHTAGFEYEARALWESRRPNDAIAALKRGLEVAPELWILWEYLGHYLSDMGRHGEALEAFRRGMACAGAPQDSFLCNLAVVYQRMGEHETALQMLQQAETARHRVPVAYLELARAYSLIQLRRFEEAERALNRADRATEAIDPEQLPTMQAMLEAYRGLIAWRRDANLARAKQYAEQALRY
ncbi:MAG: hypothetical protein NZ874_10520, partial [Fimbriimonadales bacterium]|nr:hypothetical protein [Fimbriimonadales bacterium]